MLQQFRQMRFALVAVVLLVTTVGTHTVADATPASTNWLANAGYGVMVHWTSQSRPQSGATPAAYCTAVSNFNVTTFAQQLQDAGAGYIIFTISHAQQYFAFPSPRLDSVISGRTCTRDLYSDMYAALNPKGIKMIFYYPSIGTNEDPAWRDASKFNTDPTYFAQLQYDLVSEIGNRYGNKLAGWWVDNCFDGGYGTRYNFTTYANSLRAGNPNRVVTFNFSSVGTWGSTTGSSVADYQAGEADTLDRVPTGRFSGEGTTQWHTLSWMDDFWVHTNPGTPTPRYATGDVITYTRSVIANQGVFSYNSAPYQDTLISSPALDQLRALKAAIRVNKKDDRDAAITYNGSWSAASNSNYSAGTGTWTSSAGNFAQYSFTGTGVKWYGVVGADHGKSDVYIDGALDTTVDLYANDWAANTVVYAKNNLANGLHTIKIVARSDKNAASTNRFVEVDALEFSPLATTTIDDRDPHIVYSGSWNSASSTAYYLSTARWTNSAGSATQYSFTGPGVQWIGPKGPDHGKADIYIDGALVTTIDLYAATRADQVALFSRTGLSNGTHTIKVQARSDKNAASTNVYVEVDAFEATS